MRATYRNEKRPRYIRRERSLQPGKARQPDASGLLTHRYQISHLAHAFDLLGDLTSRQLGLLGGCHAAQLGYAVVYLDVDARHLRGARVLADVGADALLQVFLLLAYTLDGAVLLADQGPRAGSE